jgi:regulator of sigma E protease
VKVLYILLAVLVFEALMVIHELGHYIFARIFKVKIFEFAIGMGPRLVWYQSKKTGIIYALRAFPFGGFVSMAGELADEGAEDLPPEAKENFPEDRDLGPLISKPAWQRLIVHAAGAVMNLISGFLLVIILTCSLPVHRMGSTTIAEFTPPVEGVVSTQSQGLQVGDTIIQVGDKKVHIADQLSYEISHQGGGDEALTLTIIRDGKEMTIDVHFPVRQMSGQLFGATDFLVYQVEKKDFATVAEQAFYKSCLNVKMVCDSLIDLIGGRYTMEAVSGPIGTAGVITDAAASGDSEYLFSLIALITINLGIFNLLPVPALDGSHIIYTLVEMVTRKKPPAKLVTILDMIGLFALLGLMVLITFKDIAAFFG